MTPLPPPVTPVSLSVRQSLVQLGFLASQGLERLPEHQNPESLGQVAYMQRVGRSLTVTLETTADAPEIELGEFGLSEHADSAELQRLLMAACAAVIHAPLITERGQEPRFGHVLNLRQGGPDPVWDVLFGGDFLPDEVNAVAESGIHPAPEPTFATLLIREWTQPEPAPGQVRDDGPVQVRGTAEGGEMVIADAGPQVYRRGEKAQVIQRLLGGVTFTLGGERLFGQKMDAIGSEEDDRIFEVICEGRSLALLGRDLEPVVPGAGGKE